MKYLLAILVLILVFGKCTTKKTPAPPAAIEVHLETRQQAYKDSLVILQTQNAALKTELYELKQRLNKNQITLQKIQKEYENTNRFYNADDSLIQRYFSDSLQ
jgi:regulator of replication initiation timing